MAEGTDDAPAIQTVGLVKMYGRSRAVDGVDLRVPAGSVYGLLGPNGAGKTTVVRILATLLRPDGGTATVFGKDTVRDAAAVRSGLMLTGQFASVDQDLTGRENLLLLARLLGFSRAHARARVSVLLKAFGLDEAARRTVKSYSGGMRRRLDIAASVIVTPDLLILDEPTTGLDPLSRRHVWDAVRALAGAGTTVLLTTQYLDEADRLADRIAVLDRGRLIAEGTTGELKASLGSAALRVRLTHARERGDARAVLARALRVPIQVEQDPVALSASIEDAARVAPALAELERVGIHLAGFSLGEPSLDEVFLALTGRPVPCDPARDEEEEAA